jgi:hypothetical protein
MRFMLSFNNSPQWQTDGANGKGENEEFKRARRNSPSLVAN